MKLQFFGATGTVTGSKYMVEEGSYRFLVDCGLFQGYKELRLRNWEPFPIDPKSIDAVILTHAHLDHSGYLPLLVREGFQGKIFASSGTRDLASIILRDAGRIQEEDTLRANVYGYSKHHPALPLYTSEDVEKALKLFRTVDFNQKVALQKGFQFSFSRSGHILGSSFVNIERDGVSLVFSGDLGRPNDPIMTHPVSVENADYLVLESTYGNRLHPRTDPTDGLQEIITKTLSRGGTVLIPAFAVGRSQTILYYLSKLMAEGKIPSNTDVYLDSPMAQEATDLWCSYQGEKAVTRDTLHAVCTLAHYVRTKEESKRLNARKGPKIIVSASGMAEGGRVLHHIKHLADDSKNSIVLVGFQAGGTRGDRLLKGEKTLKIHGELVPIRAEVVYLDSFSSHADYEEILEWLKGLKKAPKKIFLTHGEKESAEALKVKIESAYHYDVVIPNYKESFELI